jgi:hypothetical protein
MRTARLVGPVMMLLACGEGSLPPAPITTGTVEITTATVGIDQDHNGYHVIVDNNYSVVVPSNGRTLLTGLKPGDHVISLLDVADNCVATERERTLTVTVGGPEARATAAFEITCAAADKIAFTRWTWPDGQDIPNVSVAFAYLDGRPAVDLVMRGHSPSWSPDGLRIVYTRLGPCGLSCGNEGLSIAEASGGAASARQLTSDASDGDPAWSPDGATIAFTRGTRLYRIKPSDGQPEPFHAQPPLLDAYEPAWSPDGTRLAFRCSDLGNGNICVINADGSGFQRLTNNADWEDEPAWSPDGGALAFSQAQSSGWTVVVMTLATGETRAITPGSDPSWSPDGRRIVFIDYDLIDIPYEGPQLMVLGLSTIRVDGSGRAPLTRGFDKDPAWNP